MTDAETFPAALDAERVTDGEKVPTGAASEATEPAKQATQATPAAAAERRRSPWSVLSETTARAAQRAFARPKVRLTAFGGALLLLAAFFVTGSMWTAPLAIVGVLALVVAWFGSRLDGRLMLEWGESGVTFELRADVSAPHRLTQHVGSFVAPRRLGAVSNDLTVESTATTVEINVDELKALIARAEAA